MGSKTNKEMKNNNNFEPLKNKKWLFPETGKAGFHYDDVNNAVAGLKQDLKKAYTGLHEQELITWVEKWFPDATEREQVSRMKHPDAEKEPTYIAEEKQLKILAFS